MKQTIKRALLSVSDKTGVVELARGLVARSVELLSTGGTARLLREHGLPVRDVADVTGFPEIMAGRVKTLHPRIHGGLLGRRGVDEAVMREHGIPAIDLLVVNLYPFVQTVSRAGVTLDEAIENIDIGGPAMIRAAAKNHAHVAVVVDPADYRELLHGMDAGGLDETARRGLAARAFAHTAAYDSAVARHLGAESADDGPWPRELMLNFQRRLELRYGENPHQRGAFYAEPGTPQGAIGGAQQLQGKALSFNNIVDADTALECVRQFAGPACVIVKHANPCGVAEGTTLLDAYERAFATDPTSAFGGIVAFNAPVDGPTVRAIVERQFVEVIIAPAFSAEAVAAAASKQNVRLLDTGPWAPDTPAALDYRRVGGGLLVQDTDQGRVGVADLKVVTRRSPTASELADLLFAWKVVKFVKSNAIVYCRDAMTLGVGAGQMSRVYSARIAALKAADAGLSITGSVMASDAFFPFRDSVDTAAEAGIGAIVQPGGSVRDGEVIAAADEHGLAMVFTGMRHFRH